jgi:hypothetical protein
MRLRSGKVSRKPSMEKSDPFNELSDQDQKAAIDVAVAAVLIGLRIPTAGKPLYDYVATEFSSSRTLPPNIVRYALRSLGRTLFKQDWTMTITKTSEEVTTHFKPNNPFRDNHEASKIQ